MEPAIIAFTTQHDPCTEAEHGRLQEKAEGFGDGGEGAADIGGGDLLVERIGAEFLPAGEGGFAHAEGLHHFGFRTDLVAHAIGAQRAACGAKERLAGEALSQEGDAHEDDAAGNGHPAKERLEGEDGEEEDRRPGEV